MVLDRFSMKGLVGIVTERDYTRKVALKGKSSKELKVREILSESLAPVTPAHGVEDCMRLIRPEDVLQAVERVLGRNETIPATDPDSYEPQFMRV